MSCPQLKISVPQPCSENWSAMTPQAKGRFCASCATTVVDFSQFTDKQLLEYFANRSGKTCGRFSVSQLNRPVYAETLPKQNFFPRALAAVALFLGISSQAQAQNTYDHPTPAGQVIEKKASTEETPAKTVGKTPEKVSGDSLEISGRVIDKAINEGLPGVHLTIKGTGFTTYTIVDGSYKISIPANVLSDSILLQAQCIGYKANEVLVDRNNVLSQYNILLAVDTHWLGIVEIKYEAYSPYSPRTIWWKTKNLFRKND